VLTINYGIRFDYVNAYVTESQWSPRIGMVYEFSPQTSMHAGYARYFTPPPLELVAPTDIALFASTTNAPEVTTDDPVKSERANYFDIGVNTSPISGWSVGLDGYYKRSQNLLDEGQFGAAVVFEPFNYAKGYAAGVELTNSYRKGPFGAYLNIAWAQAEGTNINSAQFNFGAAELQYIATHYIYLDHNQTWTVSGGASYLWDKTTFTGDLLFGSGLREDSAAGVPNGASVGPYTTVNLAAFRPFDLGAGFGEVKGRVAVINLFDKVYLLRSGTGVGVGAPQYGMRRAFFVEISKAFK
jgi:outer membrane receptor protein involved in Fe transport